MKTILYISKKSRDSELKHFREVFYNAGYAFKMLVTDDYAGNQDKILKEIVDYEPDIILVHHNKMLMTIDFWEQATNAAKLVWWVNDERQPLPNWIRSLINTIDIWIVATKDTAKKIEALGSRAHYLIMGFKPKEYNEKERKLKLVFTGQNSGHIFPLSLFRSVLINKMKIKLGKDFNVFGRGWHLADKERQASGIYRNAKIGLSIGHYNTDGTYSNRVMQIMSNGAMCLMHRTKGIENVFGDSVVYFDDVNDCLEKYQYYIENEKERKQIAKRGYDFVHANFTWYHKAKEIIRICR